jgi:hypothetical protein
VASSQDCEKYNMKHKILIFFLIIFINSYSQKIEKRIGAIKIKKESFLIEKKKKISKSDFYFNSSGMILEKIKYGKHHFNKLNTIGEIEQFLYSNDKLELTRKYISDCQNCSYYQYYSKLKYNFDNKLINQNTFRGENDSLFMSAQYIYKPKIEEIHFNSLTYYENKYDDENRIIEQNQIFEKTNKIRWKKEFAYLKNKRVCKFQTYYGDNNENSEVEITTYNSENEIISRETFREKNKTRLQYYYNKRGIIEEIEEYESIEKSEYELKYSTKFKICKKIKNINKKVIEEINKELIGEKTSH